MAGAALLLWAIHEAPQPGNDLLQHGDELSQFIRHQQQANGSFATTGDAPSQEAKCAGIAMTGLIRSQASRPNAANLELTKKSVPIYRDWWQKDRTAEATAWMLSAYSEAYFLTKEKPFAEAVTQMADWLCTLQIGLDPKNPHWQGGFAGWSGGRVRMQQPTIESALFVYGLADACRIAQQLGDAERYGRYRDTVERGLQFVMSLQFTPANTRQFADWYQPQLYGAYFASPQDGATRLDYAQYAVCAMSKYLEQIAETPLRKN
jgi:hypothetical protein